LKKKAGGLKSSGRKVDFEFVKNSVLFPDFFFRFFQIVLSLLVAAVTAAPQQPQQQIAIVKLSNDVNPDGSFTYE